MKLFDFPPCIEMKIILISFLVTSATARTRSLNGTWTFLNSNKTIQGSAKVPGGIYSDLLSNDILKEDIYKGYNDRKYRWVGEDSWTFSTDFTVTGQELASKRVHLVFHGIDTVSQIFLNGHLIGKTNSMFLLYKFDVKDKLKIGANTLDVEIWSPIKEALKKAESLPYKIPLECWPDSYNGICHINKLRKMQASFGWDWGPAFPSLGIWKTVELEMSDVPTLRSVGVDTQDLDVAWGVNITAWFDPKGVFSEETHGTLAAKLYLDNIGDPLVFNSFIHLVKNNGLLYGNMYFKISQKIVSRWWPNGLGEPKLYKMDVTFSNDNSITSKSLRVGFRTVVLRQDPLLGGKALTFYLEVNKVPIFAKGSNWIPSHVLPELASDKTRIRRLLHDSVSANFNMLRVWGGGLYESDFFYDACDELGILIMHDLLFACNMYPATTDFLRLISEEMRQQITRLQHHPSIVLWAGSNENEVALVQNWYGTRSNYNIYKRDFISLYVDTIKPMVEFIDFGRPFVTSSPSNGLESEEEGYIASNPQNNNFGDVHYYNYLSNGWDWMIYPQPKFASEYGMQSLPDIETLKQVAEVKDLEIGSDWLMWRQHLTGGNSIMRSAILNNLPAPDNLETMIYLSQINQAMTMKVETEHYRRHKNILLSTGEGVTMGALYWQLNDIWQAPSWSSIDFNGRWKMLHYYAKNFFAPVIIVPGRRVDDKLFVYVVSDLEVSVKGNLQVHVHSWNDTKRKQSYSYSANIPARKSSQILELDIAQVFKPCGSDLECFLTFDFLDDAGLELTPENFLFPVEPYRAQYPPSTVKVRSAEMITPVKALIELESDTLALFVWLRTPSLDGTFSENGFHITRSNKKIYYTSSKEITVQDLLKDLTVNSLQPKYKATYIKNKKIKTRN